MINTVQELIDELGKLPESEKLKQPKIQLRGKIEAFLQIERIDTPQESANFTFVCIKTERT